MADEHDKMLFDPEPFYPALALLRIPEKPHTNPSQPDAEDKFGTGFFVTRRGLFLTVAHNLTDDGKPDGNPLPWVWVCCYDPHTKDWTKNHKVPVDAGLISPKLDTAVLRVPVKVSAPLRLSADWERGDDVVILGFQQDDTRASGFTVRWLMCRIPINWPVAPFELKDSSEAVLRLSIIDEGQQPLGEGISGGPGLNCLCEGYPAFAIEKATLPAHGLLYPEIETTAVHWLKEILDTLPEKRQIVWVEPRERRRTVPSGRARPLSDRKAEKRYRERVRKAHEHVEMLGRANPLELKKIYISLRVGEFVPPEDKPDEPSRRGSEASPQHRSGIIEATQALYLTPPRLAVLGEPGSGKTTLLRYLALNVAHHDRRLGDWARAIMPPAGAARAMDRILRKLQAVNVGTPGLLAGPLAWLKRLRDRLTRFPLPFYVTLNDVARSGDHLETHLARELEKARFAGPEAFLKRKLHEGECLVLLDALDEVMEVAAYQKIAEMIAAFSKDYDRVPVVVTCRTAAFRDQRTLFSGFCRLEVQEFTEKDLESFIRKWFGAPPGGTRSHVEGLLQSLGRSARMRQLASNPLLLSIICLLYERDLRLPERRVELYQRCVDELLEKIEHVRGLDTKADFPADTKRWALRAIARRFHEKGMRLVGEGPLLEALEKELPDLGYESTRKEEFLQEVMERSGLIRRQSKTSYNFAHFTFQEFFTAEHLHARGEGETLDARRGDLWWREVILLYVGLQADATELLRRLKEHDSPLAAAALADANDAGTKELREVAAEIIGDLKKLVEDDSDRRQEAADSLAAIGKWGASDYLVEYARAETQPAVSLAAVLALDRAGDRNVLAGLCEPVGPMLRLLNGYLGKVSGEVDERILSLLDRLGFPMVFVLAGDFLMSDERFSEVLTDYWIGKFPVTNALYKRFTNETGYRAKGGWPKDFQPGKEEHPAAWLTFHDALEFCTWSGTVLPSEAEWEKAARGTDGRKYPWGDQWDSTRCNASGRGTTPVDTHPSGVSPCGCLDMAGNVWEWTRNLFKEDSYPHPESLWLSRPHRPRPPGPVILLHVQLVPPEHDGHDLLDCGKYPNAGGDRVLRGGAFDDDDWYVRCASRGWSNPDDGYRNYGFRVAVSPVFSAALKSGFPRPRQGSPEGADAPSGDGSRARVAGSKDS